MSKDQYTDYKIKRGDSLSKISGRTGISVEELCVVNGIDFDKKDFIRAGDTLKIPSAWTREAPHTKDEYFVRRGDTLNEIARDYGISVKEIQRLNPEITNPNLIKIGQKIRLHDDAPAANAGGDLTSLFKRAREERGGTLPHDDAPTNKDGSAKTYPARPPAQIQAQRIDAQGNPFKTDAERVAELEEGITYPKNLDQLLGREPLETSAPVRSDVPATPVIPRVQGALILERPIPAPAESHGHHNKGITSHFGERSSGKHTGTDLKTTHLDPNGHVDLRAQQEGIVVEIGTQIGSNGKGYGNRIAICYGTDDKDRPIIAQYAHLDRLPNLKPGDVVRPGDYIGTTGTSGAPGQPHLHYEVMVGKNFISPEDAFGVDLSNSKNVDRLISEARSEIGNKTSLTYENIIAPRMLRFETAIAALDERRFAQSMVASRDGMSGQFDVARKGQMIRSLDELIQTADASMDLNISPPRR